MALWGAAAVWCMAPASAQFSPDFSSNLSQRGYFELNNTFYPQAGLGDSGRAISTAHLRWEASYKPASWVTFNVGFDARTDSHRQTQRTWDVNFNGQTIQRPAFSARRFSALISRGNLTLELGRQYIRWGKTDILNPTDRFAPKDYLSSVVDTDFLGVNAVRANYAFGSLGLDSVEVVWQPIFTPTRTPLLNQRWTVLPPEANGVRLVDQGARIPGRSQYGVRYNHVGSGYEYSLSYFDGFNYLPSLAGTLRPTQPGQQTTVDIYRTYPQLRLYGADTAIPLRWFTVKAEGAYFTTTTPGAEQYSLYVLQLERFVGEWSFVGGYAGSVITRHANVAQFAADRGVARSFIGRVGYTIDVNRSAAVETVVRAGGSFVRFEYSQAAGQHWRTTATAAWIRGKMNDFIGQYQRNSYVSLALRYSF